MLDGEIVIDADGAGEEFGSLQLRLHPAASRIERLSRELPASYVAFDLLARDGVELLEQPFESRREALEQIDGVRRSPELVRDPAPPRSAGSSRPRASSPNASMPPTPQASARRW